MKNDAFGDVMKGYERLAERWLDPALPICVRVDGRSFSTYTRGCQKPFDPRVSAAMRAAARALVEETNARIGYTQSDEITLIIQTEPGQTPLFDGRAQKLASVLASVAAVRFDRTFGGAKLPSFDCRVWQVPDRDAAADVVLWRALDAHKNGVSSAFRALFSAPAMEGKKRPQMIAEMRAAGVDYATAFAAEDRLGTYFRRVAREGEIPDDVWDVIPPHARPETRTVVRRAVEAVPMPFFGAVTNRVAVIFDAAAPQTAEETADARF